MWWAVFMASIGIGLVGCGYGCAASPAPFLGAEVLVDPGASVVFAAAPAGLQAVDVRTGSVRWQSHDALRPLAVVGDALLAHAAPRQPGELRLGVLDLATGRTRRALTVPLPPQVYASVDETLGGRFRICAVPDGGHASIVWIYEARPTSGAAPEPPTVPAHAEGALRLAVGTGDWTAAATPTPGCAPDGAAPLGRYVWRDTVVLQRLERQIGSGGIAPPQLVAHGLDGTLRWRVVLRDVVYRGPYPP